VSQGSDAVRVTMDVAAHRVACTGVARMQCLRVRVAPDTSWLFFYQEIEGFTFEDGYRWRLEVERRQIPNPPEDGSSLSYKLVRVLTRDPE
jgi:hypothetical protein